MFGYISFKKKSLNIIMRLTSENDGRSTACVYLKLFQNRTNISAKSDSKEHTKQHMFTCIQTAHAPKPLVQGVPPRIYIYIYI